MARLVAAQADREVTRRGERGKLRELSVALPHIVNLKTIGILALALFFASASRSHALGWALVNAKIRSEFPDVRRTTTAELAAWLKDRSRPAPLLLDVRTKAEFEVSHLERATHIDPGASASAVPARKDQPIVT